MVIHTQVLYGNIVRGVTSKCPPPEMWVPYHLDSHVPWLYSNQSLWSWLRNTALQTPTEYCLANCNVKCALWRWNSVLLQYLPGLRSKCITGGLIWFRYLRADTHWNTIALAWREGRGGSGDNTEQFGQLTLPPSQEELCTASRENPSHFLQYTPAQYRTFTTTQYT